VDMTPAMIDKANANKARLGYANVEFRIGDIESLPVDSASIDVVISNCVLNLVPDKQKAFSEIFRVLKPGGHMSVSDIVVSSPLPEKITKVAVLYAGCIGGAQVKGEYLAGLGLAGFKGVHVVRERELPIPDGVLAEYLTQAEIRDLRDRRVKVMSITLNAQKPNV
jgi:arsenite methyltransferase